MIFLLIPLSVLLYWAAFPYPGQGFLGFFCLVPLFSALDRAGSWKRALAMGFVFGGLVSSAMAYWLFWALTHPYEKSVPVALIFLFAAGVLPYGLLYGLFGTCYRVLKRKDGLLFRTVTVAALWTAIEYLKEAVPVLIPWAHLGYASLGVPAFAQSADVAGLYGLTFLLAAVNGLVAYLLRPRDVEPRPLFRSQSLRALLVLVLLFLIPTAYGVLKGREVEADISGELSMADAPRAVLVQASYSQKERWSGMGFYGRVKTYLDLSACPEGQGLCVVVWPETVLNQSAMLTDDFLVTLIQQMGPDVLLIAGGLLEDKNLQETYNAAYFLSGTGRVLAYAKNILLPYAESAPFGGDLLGDYYTAPARFHPGRTRNHVAAPEGTAGVSICFESLYPGFVAKSVRNGASFLVNLSNDTWFGDTTMPRIHLMASRMRAIENRRFVLRASNSGFSALIDPAGRVRVKSRLFAREAVTGRFAMRSGVTLYTRLGNFPVWLSLAWLAAAFALALAKRQKTNG